MRLFYNVNARCKGAPLTQTTSILFNSGENINAQPFRNFDETP